MKPADFPLERYFERIGITGMPLADETGLQTLHAAQTFSIPFENLDIHLGRTISLKPDDLVEKIVFRKRGGYCFELNQLLRMALAGCGFTVRPVLARVLYQRSEPGPLTHEALIVTVSGWDWLCDAGFGGPGLRLPLPVTPRRVSEQYGETFRLRRSPHGAWVLQKKAAEGFLPLYTFLDLPALDVDIEMSNHFTSTWPSSIFRQHRMCALLKPAGRVALLDRELTVQERGRSRKKTVPAGPDYIKALSKYFGIELGTEYEDFIL